MFYFQRLLSENPRKMFMQMQPIDYAHMLIRRQSLESLYLYLDLKCRLERSTIGQQLLRHPLCGVGVHCAVNTLIEGGLQVHHVRCYPESAAASGENTHGPRTMFRYK